MIDSTKATSVDGFSASVARLRAVGSVLWRQESVRLLIMKMARPFRLGTLRQYTCPNPAIERLETQLRRGLAAELEATASTAGWLRLQFFSTVTSPSQHLYSEFKVKFHNPVLLRLLAMPRTGSRFLGLPNVRLCTWMGTGHTRSVVLF